MLPDAPGLESTRALSLAVVGRAITFVGTAEADAEDDRRECCLLEDIEAESLCSENASLSSCDGPWRKKD